MAPVCRLHSRPLKLKESELRLEAWELVPRGVAWLVDCSIVLGSGVAGHGRQERLKVRALFVLELAEPLLAERREWRLEPLEEAIALAGLRTWVEQGLVWSVGFLRRFVALLRHS